MPTSLETWSCLKSTLLMKLEILAVDTKFESDLQSSDDKASKHCSPEKLRYQSGQVKWLCNLNAATCTLFNFWAVSTKQISGHTKKAGLFLK